MASSSEANATNAVISDVHDLDLDYEKLQDLFGIKANDKTSKFVYYDYYSLNALQKAINATNLINRLNVIPDIVNIICSFCSITKWSQTDKSKIISIVNSNDNNIEYAVITKSNPVFHDNAFFDNWIDYCNDKLIYRYIFKYYTNLPIKLVSGIDTLYCGFVSSQYTLELEDVAIPIGEDKNSMRVWTAGGGFVGLEFDGGTKTVEQVTILNTGETIKLKTDSIDWKDFSLEKLESDVKNETGECYFMFEINFMDNTLKFMCKALEDVKHGFLQCKIPAKLVKEWHEEQKAIRMGVTLHCLKECGGIGLGLVKHTLL